MFENLSLVEVLKLLAPLIVLQFSLMFFCIYNIIKNGVRNLNKGIWILIVVFVEIFGSIIFLKFGRKKGYDD